VPELPEVETVRDGLARHVVGRTISSAEVLHPRPVRRDHRGPAGFATALTGRRIDGARRRGKYLWLPLDNGDALLGHLGMSGQLVVQVPGAPDERHLRVRLGLSPLVEERAQRASRDPATQPLELRFVDQRMFGGLAVSEGGAELPPEIAHIARDPFDPEFDDDVFVGRVRRRTAGVKRLLLDQTLVSGVGNIYADEALWRARIHGDRPGDRLRPIEIRRVLAEARAVMGAALVEGGTSFDALYVNVNGESGYFDRSLHAYGREGEECDRCGTPIRRVEFMNRSSFFCPRCQPVPRPRRIAARD
jgi:formamidopyrimidine-DNA glycosylase